MFDAVDAHRYQPYLKHANVYCELCSSIMTTYFYMHDDACA